MSLNSSISTLFASLSPILISKNTTGFSLFGSFGGATGLTGRALSSYKFWENNPLPNFLLFEFISFSLLSIKFLTNLTPSSVSLSFSDNKFLKDSKSFLAESNSSLLAFAIALK